jgi:hypothetical protein
VPADLESERLFTQVLLEGTDEAIALWLGTGAGAVRRLHQELTGEQRVVVPKGTPDRLLLDNLTWASHEVAGAFPDEFLATFADNHWDEDPFVCSGLGAIHRPEVTERLMRILTNQDQWLRVSAAAALRDHRHPNLKAVLEDALQDPDYLVRYHVEERLGELDDEG